MLSDLNESSLTSGVLVFGLLAFALQTALALAFAFAFAFALADADLPFGFADPFPFPLEPVVSEGSPSSSLFFFLAFLSAICSRLVTTLDKRNHKKYPGCVGWC